MSVRQSKKPYLGVNRKWTFHCVPTQGVYESGSTPYIEWLRIKTRNILCQPDNWTAVEALAAALLKKRKLSGAAACRVIDAAIEEFWKRVLAKPSGLQDSAYVES